MRWRWPLASVVLLPKPMTPGSAWKSIRPIPTEGHPSHCLARPAQTSEVIKNKQSETLSQARSTHGDMAARWKGSQGSSWDQKKDLR